MSWFRKVIDAVAPPASGKFFQSLKEISRMAQEAAKMLEGAARDGRLGTAGFAAEIHALENRADAATERFLLSVRHTMIHPIDPDDLREIADRLDSCIDTMDHYSWRMEAFRLKPTAVMIGFIALIRQMADTMTEMFDLLLHADLTGLDAGYRRLNELERQADGLFHSAVHEMHASGGLCYTVEDEVISTLEKCSDRCRDVGHLLVVMTERNR
ncbi:MAG: hypothetical protein A3G34_15775 [Candidatus Lindowbacteria bacterium RIFCSPLOWO2_12_FULL_62_27]|nr:MAG: hypothetical protein A3G34_15775 [Candidatus Lindowbacteria bacterium RIFCSPLOWO2_12_FULL_62_27]